IKRVAFLLFLSLPGELQTTALIKACFCLYQFLIERSLHVSEGCRKQRRLRSAYFKHGRRYILLNALSNGGRQSLFPSEVLILIYQIHSHNSGSEDDVMQAIPRRQSQQKWE